MRKGLLGVLGYCLFGAAPLLAQTLPPAQVSAAQRPVTLGAPIPTSDPAPVVPEQHIRVQFNTEAPPLPSVSSTSVPAPVTSKREAFVPTLEPALAMRDSPFTEPANNANRYRIWASADYLLWWVKGAPLPGPLVSTGNPNDNRPGATNQPGTQVLLGNSSQNYGAFSGGRFTLGGWIDPCQTFGVEGSGFLLERRSTRFFAASDGAGNPPLYIPFNNTDPRLAGPDSVFIADPLQQFSGSVAVTSSLQLWGAELNGVLNVCRRPGLEFNLLAGFRYMDLRENLTIATSSTDLTNGTISTTNDRFNTHNQFYGGQLGGRLSLQHERWFVDLTGKVALGSTYQVVNIQGESSQTGPAAATPGTFPGGIFAQPSNIGRSTRNQFGVVPSAEVKLGYQLTNWMRVFAGYDYMYWNQVVRPGNQIDRNVNTSQNTILNGGPGALIGPSQPSPLFNRSDFWAHGASFGVEFRY